MIRFHDPSPIANDYLTRMFFSPMRAYAGDHGIPWKEAGSLTAVNRGDVVLSATDHLTSKRIGIILDRGAKLIGFNVTDSSYFHNSLRHSGRINDLSAIFMLSGIPTKNACSDVRMTQALKLEWFDCPFLPDDEWATFSSVRHKLHSLPYVPWSPIPEVGWTPLAHRSQKCLLRGGSHMRRFLLALELMKFDLLDANSGFCTFQYFGEDMNPAFQYCNSCRVSYRAHGGRYPSGQPRSIDCTNPQSAGMDLSDLGLWNNRCPNSFFRVAEKLGAPMPQVEQLLNARWIDDLAHQQILARMKFTSDFKWIHSIYAPQRFWQGAAAGAVNVLPGRTMDQEFFPAIEPNKHYITYPEDFKDLGNSFILDEYEYEFIADNALAVYHDWMKPDRYPISTNLLQHMWNKIQEHCS